MAVRWSRESDRDLWDIFDFGAAEYGPERANSYILGLYDAAEDLLANPARGSLRLAEPPTRMLIYRSHAIFYQIADEDILIVRILHGRADWAAAFDVQ